MSYSGNWLKSINGGEPMSADGRLDKLNDYKQLINSFYYAGLKREEAKDLLALGFRLYRDSEHMVQVKNEIQRLENVIKKQAKEIRKLKRLEEVATIDANE
jgi:hypothetical protein